MSRLPQPAERFPLPSVSWPPQPSALSACRGGGALLALAAGVALLACEGAPARSKPWRHVTESTAPAETSPVAHLLEEERARVEAHENRDTTLRIHVDADVRHLHPLAHPTEWGRRITQDTVYETLLRYRPGTAKGGPGHYEPGVLSSWKSWEREIRLVVREGARWHDGRRLTSVDVQFSIDMARSPRGHADHLRPMLSDITSVELVNPRVVKIGLARPNSYVLRALAELPVVPAHIYYGKWRAKGLPIIGSGPYKVESKTDRRVVLRRWDDYRGPRPAIETLVFVFEPDAAVALTAAKRGELDIVPSLIPAHYPQQARAPGIQRDFVPLRLAPADLRYLVVNLSEPPFDDRRVRQAVALLIDRDTIAGKVWSGLAEPVAGPVWPGGPADGASPAPPGHNAAEAADLLERAGWKRDGSGVRRRSGERLKVDVLITEEKSEERDGVLKALRKAGIATEIRVGSPAVLRNRLRDGEFDLAFMSVSGFSDRDLRDMLSSGGKHNYGKYSSLVVDGLLSSMARLDSPEERSPLASKLAAQLARDMPIIPLVRPAPYGLVSRRVSGLQVWNGWIGLRDLALERDD